eukprot:scpid10214/ scgid4894/ Protein-methionine sulfoxide oxidase MICAL3; Molecule interacting with CasL protein 3
MDPKEVLFNEFSQSIVFGEVLSKFQELRDLAGIDTSLYGIKLYHQLRARLTSWKTKSLWTIMDKRVGMKEYCNGEACAGQRVLIVGAGPSGLRMGVEASLLGADVVLVEKRNSMTRNNVLHLWPFCIEDLRLLGAKKFYGKFCAGAIDHIGIRQLQFILLKVALVLGCRIHWQTTMQEIVPPKGPGSGHGWGVRIDPCDHPAANGFYDVIIGADGRRSCIPGFGRKEFRGKLALAITANFVNNHTREEAAVEEISGVAFIFNQRFFKDLDKQYGISLENIVYYKDATHYFVMTAKKASLLQKGVLREDCSDSRELLRRSNINSEKLELFSREAAGFSTALPRLDFAINKDDKPDVALFDFTSIYAAENSTRIQEKHGHRLLLTLVGDSLLEPFWPMGTGCARAFLSVYDTAWAMKAFAQPGSDPIDLLVERESIYHLLPSTTPDKLLPKIKEYTIDPLSRYPNLNRKAFKRCDADALYWTAELIENLTPPTAAAAAAVPPQQALKQAPQQVPQQDESLPRHRSRSDEEAKAEKKPPCPAEPVAPSHVSGPVPKTDPEMGGKGGKTALRRMSTADLWQRASRRITEQKSRRVRLSQRTQPKVASNAASLLTWCQEIASKNGVVIKDFSASTWKNGMAFCAILHYYLPKAIKFSSLKPKNGQANCKLAFEVAAAHLTITSNINAADMGEADELSIIAYLSQYYQRLSSAIPGKVETNEASRLLTLKQTSSQWTSLSERKSITSIKTKASRESVHSSRSQESLPDESSKMPPAGPTLAAGVVSSKDRNATKTTSALEKPGKRKAPSAPQTTNTGSAAAVKPTISAPAYKRSVSKSDTCHFCSARLYVVERVSAEGCYFHRRCWRCEQCNTQLVQGSYAYAKGQDGQAGTFYCKAHFKQLFMSNPSAIGYDRAKAGPREATFSPPSQRSTVEPSIPEDPISAPKADERPVAPSTSTTSTGLAPRHNKGRAPSPPGLVPGVTDRVHANSPLPTERLSKMLEANEVLEEGEDDDVHDQETARKIELKQAQYRRLHAAQQIQFEMGLLEQQQAELEEESKDVEEALRDDSTLPEDHQLLMGEWMAIVNERNLLVRHEWELTLLFKDLQLEDIRQQIENDLRKRGNIPENKKSNRDKAEEARLLEQLVEVVESRNKLVNETEEERIRDMEMDRAVEDTMRKRGYDPTARRSTHIGCSGSQTPPTPRSNPIKTLLGRSRLSKEQP